LGFSHGRLVYRSGPPTGSCPELITPVSHQRRRLTVLCGGRVNAEHLNNPVLAAFGLDPHLHCRPSGKGIISASLEHAHVQEGITAVAFQFDEPELLFQIEPAHPPS
jgi:hypothetical protein